MPNILIAILIFFSFLISIMLLSDNKRALAGLLFSLGMAMGLWLYVADQARDTYDSVHEIIEIRFDGRVNQVISQNGRVEVLDGRFGTKRVRRVDRADLSMGILFLSIVRYYPVPDTEAPPVN